jgi:hypothetical protein
VTDRSGWPPGVGRRVISTVATSGPDWRWPDYERSLAGAKHCPPLLRPPLWRALTAPLLAASYTEWRYYAVIAPAFHGICGLALINPDDCCARVAESGLLLIIAGIVDPPAPDRGSEATPPQPGEDLCWMHRFPLAGCKLDGGDLDAEDAGHRLTLRHDGPCHAEIELRSVSGLGLRMTHAGPPDSAIEPVFGDDFRHLPGAHWVVHCPSPFAASTGELHLGPELAETLPAAPRPELPCRASPRLLERIGDDTAHVRWQHASGYAEHSYGVNPLPLHGWDFLFVPDAQRAQSVVLQTYRGSRRLRYVEACWLDDQGRPRRQRFDHAQMTLHWDERCFDPELGVERPLRRTIRAEAAGLHLRVDNRVLHRIPLLRPERLLVRHFFISEEIGVADWVLTDDRGRALAEARGQPCGGELAHFRLRTRAPRRAG